jgi:ribbon-helix-helix CopG family protein
MSADVGRERISVRLDVDIITALERTAGRERSTPSAVVRRVLAAWMRETSSDSRAAA